MTAVTAPTPPKGWLRNYLPMWIGQALSILGSALVQFALVWYLTKQTGSAVVLSTATLLAMLPSVLLGPFAGALVDRWNRKLTMILSDGLVALATLALGLLFATGSVQTWHIYLVLFLRSLAGIFQFPAMKASVSLMVPAEHFTRLSGINQTLDGLVNIASAPLGALLLEILPMQGILAIDIATALIAILLLVALVHVPQPQRSPQSGKATPRQLWQDVRQGLRYAATWPGLLILVIGAALINMLATPAFTLLPLLVSNHYGGGALELGWFDSAFGVGLMLGGVLLSTWGGFRRKTLTMFLGLILMGVGILAIGVIPSGSIWPAILLMGFVGLNNALTNGPLSALLQSKVAPELQGRIFSVIGSLAGAASPLGIVIAGPVAERFGIQVLFIASGILTVILGVAGLVIPAVFTLDDQLPGGAPIPSTPAVPATKLPEA